MYAFFDNTDRQLADGIIRRLDNSRWAFFAVAFIQRSGVQVLEDAIRRFIARGGELLILFGIDFATTEADAIRHLEAIGVECRYHKTNETFHVKGYLFGASTFAAESAIVGSSSLSRPALTRSAEWNIVIESDHWNLRPIINAAEQLWKSPASKPVTEHLLAELERMARQIELTRHPQDELTNLAKPSLPSRTIEFAFTINDSFLNPKYNYPITIPTEFNDRMRDWNLDTDTARIYSFGAATGFDGRIYSSKTRKTEYHRVNATRRNGDALSLLPLGQKINVRIGRGEDGVEVRLSPID